MLEILCRANQGKDLSDEVLQEILSLEQYHLEKGREHVWKYIAQKISIRLLLF